MSTTSRNRILLIAVATLLLANIVMVYIFINKGHEKKGHEAREAMMTKFLEKEIGFTPQQMQQYDTLSKGHHEKVKAAFDELRKSKAQLLKELGAAGFSDSAINAAVNRSAEKQKEMELGMLMHFVAIRKLCTPQQQPKFDSLFYKVLSRKGENH